MNTFPSTLTISLIQASIKTVAKVKDVCRRGCNIAWLDDIRQYHAAITLWNLFRYLVQVLFFSLDVDSEIYLLDEDSAHSFFSDFGFNIFCALSEIYFCETLWI